MIPPPLSVAGSEDGVSALTQQGGEKKLVALMLWG